MGGFPWAHGRTIIPMRAAEWMQQGEDSWEVIATDLQHSEWWRRGLAHDAQVRQVLSVGSFDEDEACSWV